jgi:(p)ppGpp synthase/HD superfamily hydrolase
VKRPFFEKLRRAIDLCYEAHTEHPLRPDKAVRKWDGRTPYFAHPVWCATAILHEPALPEALRQDGAQALALHDVLEDTTLRLPKDISPRVRKLVEHMTFPGGSAQEMEEVWGKPPEVRLLKLYDKTCNMMDDRFLPEERRRKGHAYVRKLAKDVDAHFPGTNIVKLARALARSG